MRIVFISMVVLCIGCDSKNAATRSSFKGTTIAEFISYNETKFPSYNANFPPPPGTKEVFELSQNYPDTFEKEVYPWQKIDCKADPQSYMNSVLEYCLEGNVEVDFKGQYNKVRKWYHAPWLHDDGKYDSITKKYIGNGREYMHGLTRELATPKYKIHLNQDIELENWAVGLYNPPGGYTLGKIWHSPIENPDPTQTNFPEGTVSFKLLFTDGTKEKVPFLEGSLEWDANIYPCNPKLNTCTDKVRINRKVRLLQIDIAIKDSSAGKIGWVFGTFIYDASKKGPTVWSKMVPVGLSWGDDPNVTSELNRDGAFINKSLKESYLNASLLKKDEYKYTNEAYIQYHGLGGRLNGPVDNPLSSCVSCHGQAGINSAGDPLKQGNFDNGINRSNYPLSSFQKYFTNVPPGSFTRAVDNKSYTTTDYSLQVSTGVRNYYKNAILKEEILLSSNKSKKELNSYTKDEIREIATDIKDIPEISRGEH